MDANAVVDPIIAGHGLELLKDWAKTFVSFLGIGAFLMWMLKKLILRFFQHRDEQTSLHISTKGKQIDADVALIQSLLERVKTLETNFKEQTDKIVNLTETNARLTVEAKHKDEEIAALRLESSKRQERIAQLEREVAVLQEQVAKLLRGEKQ